ncbi:hypothetical protein CJ030_MR1G022974 [Morella rubra]|uniref:Uncharacterized protein n=1 Tax=Morella rubra TaxID=262757 RepID=A0A6A1WWB2_9ROSI|nr:hypothetical protein CJ030_MR1G022974 [Morella rubra]
MDNVDGEGDGDGIGDSANSAGADDAGAEESRESLNSDFEFITDDDSIDEGSDEDNTDEEEQWVTDRDSELLLFWLIYARTNYACWGRLLRHARLAHRTPSSMLPPLTTNDGSPEMANAPISGQYPANSTGRVSHMSRQLENARKEIEDLRNRYQNIEEVFSKQTDLENCLKQQQLEFKAEHKQLQLEQEAMHAQVQSIMAHFNPASS